MSPDRSAVTIEPLRTGHGALLFDVLQADAIYDFIDEQRPESVQQLEQRHAFMMNPDSPPADQRWLNWLVTERRGGRTTIVGTVQATVHVNRRVAVVGYILAPEHWGRGLASTAVTLMLKALATEHHVQTATAYIDSQNNRSRALAERLGFTPAEISPDLDGNMIYQLVLDDRHSSGAATAQS